jgi:hypothetical protein
VTAERAANTHFYLATIHISRGWSYRMPHRQTFVQYRDMMRAMDQIDSDYDGPTVKATILSVLQPADQSGMKFVLEAPLQFIYCAAAGTKTAPFNSQLMVCLAYELIDRSAFERPAQKDRHKFISFYAQRDWMQYPGIEDQHLPPAGVGNLNAHEPCTITLNDLCFGVDRGHIWVTCNATDHGPHAFTNFVMPFDPELLTDDEAEDDDDDDEAEDDDDDDADTDNEVPGPGAVANESGVDDDWSVSDADSVGEEAAAHDE